jgi:hypothetical protein
MATAAIAIAGQGIVRHGCDSRATRKRDYSDYPAQAHGLAPSRHG